MSKAIKKLTAYITGQQEKRKKEIHQTIDEVFKREIFCLINPTKVKKIEEIASIAQREALEKFDLQNECTVLNDINAYYLEKLQTPFENFKHRNHVFGDYSILCDLLKRSGLNSKEQWEILFHFLKKDLYNFNENSIIVKFESIKDKINQHILPDDKLKQFLYEDGMEKILSKSSKNREEVSVGEFYLICLLYRERKRETKTIQTVKALRDSIFAGKSLPLETLLQAFHILGISDFFCEIAKTIVHKEEEKRTKEEQVQMLQKKEMLSKQKETLQELVLTSRERKRLQREIEEVFDLEINEVKRPLFLEEIILLVSKMYKLGIKEEEIKKCIQKIYKRDLWAYKTTTEKLIDYYEKIKYYEKNPEIGKAMKNILIWKSELVKKANVTHYLEWKNIMEEEFVQIWPFLMQNVEYELEEGLKRSKYLSFNNPKRSSK